MWGIKIGAVKDDRTTKGYKGDELTEGGRKAYEYYLRARYNRGWWNDNKVGTLTYAQFLGIYELYEAGGLVQALDWVKKGTGYQLFLQTPDKFGGDYPYCKGEICGNGVFNFIAAYSGYGKFGDNSLLVVRFANLSKYKPALPLGYDSETVADAAADIGNDIMGNRSYYHTARKPSSVPFHFGYETDKKTGVNYFVARSARGELLYQYPPYPP